LSCIETLYLRGVVAKGVWRDDPRNPRRFEAWLKANAASVRSSRSESEQWRLQTSSLLLAARPGSGFFLRSTTGRIPPFGGLLGDGDRQALTVPNSKRYGETH
jgi:hypothetical protein